MFVISEILWLDDIVAKIEQKHRVSMDEVEDALQRRPKVQRLDQRTVIVFPDGEHRQMSSGFGSAERHVEIFAHHTSPFISARDMDAKERRRYARK
jgi:uncharacterized DUF497 family protein